MSATCVMDLEANCPFTEGESSINMMSSPVKVPSALLSPHDGVPEVEQLYVSEMGNTFQLAVHGNASPVNSPSVRVLNLLIVFCQIVGFFQQRTGQRQRVNEADIRIELGRPGVADTYPVGVPGNGTANLATGGGTVAPHIRIPIGNPSHPDADINSRGIGVADGDDDGEGRTQVTTNGFFFLVMGIISQIEPSVMQAAGSTNKHSLKVLLWGINMSAAGCFISSFFGLMSSVVHMLGCRLFSRSSLQKAQKICLIAAITFMMAAMSMVFVFVPVAMI